MPPDPLILGFDTSAAHCAAALLSGDTVLAARHEDMAKGQAERLVGLLEDVLADAGIGWAALAGLGVGVGPGNFTGIRIAVATARGLSMGLDIPAIGVTALEAIAEGAEGPCLALVDARAGRVYAQAFPDTPDTGPRLLALDDLGANYAPTLPRLGAMPGSAAPVYAVAEAIARIAARRFGHADGPPKPLYIRPADAAPSRDAPPVILHG